MGVGTDKTSRVKKEAGIGASAQQALFTENRYSKMKEAFVLSKAKETSTEHYLEKDDQRAEKKSSSLCTQLSPINCPFEPTLSNTSQKLQVSPQPPPICPEKIPMYISLLESQSNPRKMCHAQIYNQKLSSPRAIPTTINFPSSPVLTKSPSLTIPPKAQRL
ncbi:hypothetical protein RJT34_25947 [Clitoria ternatea]|uniref:Uncharacterized protein n=1 Tax=Clitoria ternatea TaxID=43366 RepID=A0AAN9IFF5_CLITE